MRLDHVGALQGYIKILDMVLDLIDALKQACYSDASKYLFEQLIGKDEDVWWKQRLQLN